MARSSNIHARLDFYSAFPSTEIARRSYVRRGKCLTAHGRLRVYRLPFFHQDDKFNEDGGKAKGREIGEKESFLVGGMATRVFRHRRATHTFARYDRRGNFPRPGRGSVPKITIFYTFDNVVTALMRYVPRGRSPSSVIPSFVCLGRTRRSNVHFPHARRRRRGSPRVDARGESVSLDVANFLVSRRASTCVCERYVDRICM